MSDTVKEPQLAEVDFNPFEGPDLLSSSPSTEAQREIWTSVGLGDDASCAFNESISLHLTGPLDVSALKLALQDLLQRHEALRSTLSSDGSTICVNDAAPIDLQDLDFAPLDPDQKRALLQELLRREVSTPFDLQRGPLLRPQLVRLAPQDYQLVLTAHHIICDGWSMAVLLNDLAGLYNARKNTRKADLPEAARFAAYAQTLLTPERQQLADADLAYWQSRFSDSVPVLELPLDGPRPTSRTFRSDRIDHLLSSELCDSIKQLGARNGCSFFVTMLAAFHVFLHRMTGQSDIVIGVPAAGQSVDGLPTLVGHCVQMLPVRLQLRPDAPFVEQLRQVRSCVLDAYDHQRLTFGTLLQKLPIGRDPSRLPLVSVTFNVDQAVDGQKLGFENLDVAFHSNPRLFENFELFVNAAETRGQVVLECQYKTDLFSKATVEARMASFEQLLRSAVANPAKPCDRLNVLTVAERSFCEHNVNATHRDYETYRYVHELFAQTAANHPDKPALCFEGQCLTFGQLDARANQLAHAIRARHLEPGDRVGILLPRSADMVVAVLGVLKAGCSYVPLDPTYPQERIAFMRTDAKLRLLITETAGAVSQNDCELLALRETDLQSFDASTAPQDHARGSLPPDQRPAYVLYTSGSTGKPKGVMVPHRAVVNFLLAMSKQPGLTREDTLLAITTLSFDISVLELFLPLVVGARCVIASSEQASDGAALLELMHKESPTVLQATPSTWRMLLANGWKGSPTLRALCGGEAMPRDLAAELIPRCQELWNMFGPTETTVWSSCQRMRSAEGIISIGKPIDNTQMYVLDSHLELQPTGVVGELFIGGHGVTLGYLDRPELTAERFLPNPFAEDNAGSSSRLYRTGDLARLLSDGTFEHLGRTDFQVKLRGYRIELGEIENHLRSHPSTQDAAAMVREDRPGDMRLVAYVVPAAGKSLDTDELRNHLRKFLADYMIPQHFVELAFLPLTPNGKIDRKSLPAPQGIDYDDRRQRIAPRNETEEKLAKLWAEVLGVQKPSIDDNFFQHGGHSLLATQFVAKLAREHGIELPLRKVFEAPTIQGLAELIAASTPELATHRRGIPRRTGKSPAPLSLMQRRLWYIDQVNPGGIVYNLPSAFRFHGKLNLSALQAAMDSFLSRHQSLRTSLPWHEEAPAQVVRDSLRIDLTPTDLSSLPAETRVAEAIRQMRHDASLPFDLAKGPLCRGGLFRIADDDHILYFTPHHAVFDGWSFDIYLRDLSELYAAACENREPRLPELPVQYGDFAEWQRDWLAGPQLTRQQAYWTKQLGGTLPVLEIPTDHPRPEVMSFQGDTSEFFVSKERMEALSTLARANGATLYMVLLAAWKTLLHRMGGQNEVLVGSPIQGRSHADLQDLVGFFANALVFRTKLDSDMSFLALLARVREVCLDAYSHQDIPFEQLIEALNPPRDLSRSQIYQAFFTYQDIRTRPTQFGNLALSQINVHLPASPTDLSIWFKEKSDGIVGALDFALDLFEPSTAKALVERYLNLLDALCEAPDCKLSSLSILSDKQRHFIVEEVNATASPYADDDFVHDLISRQAQSAPERVAIAFAQRQLTYAELDARSNCIAHALRKEGAKPGDLVGLHMNRSEQMVVSLLAILKAGCAYVPLDPAFPHERLLFMMQDASLRLILTESELASDSFPCPSLFVDQLPLRDFDAQQAPADSERQALPPKFRPAYVIYTSGSTGKPKGVSLPHRAVVNFLLSMRKTPGLGPEDTILALTTLSFDIAVLELLLPLTVGARCVIASRDESLDGSQLNRLIHTFEPTVLQATPSTWRMLLVDGLRPSKKLKALCGGEAMPKDLASELLPICSELWNMYGPTETTVWSTCTQIKNADSTITVGGPIDNTQLYVLDANLQPLPVGMPGELFIGGHGVALGYLNRPELNAERFIPNPFADMPGASERLYRTGDLARLLPNGAFEHLGRTDSQVKLRGFRIELGEIENQLRGHKLIREAAVIVREDRPGDRRLTAYFVPSSDLSPTATDLRDFLHQTLPDYMIPQHFMELKTLPQTPNGKIDRKKLPAIFAFHDDDTEDFVEPVSANEKLIAAIWAKAIGVPRVGRYDNFFQLGGHSLLSMEVVADIRRKTGHYVSPKSLLLDTLEQVAAQLPTAATSPPRKDPTVTPLPGTQAHKDSLAKRLWGRITGK